MYQTTDFIFSAMILVWTICACSTSGKETSERQNAAKKYYIQNCSSCHGMEGGGTALGVPLRGRRLETDVIKKSVLNGSARMPRFTVSDSLLIDLSQWIQDLK